MQRVSSRTNEPIEDVASVRMEVALDKRSARQIIESIQEKTYREQGIDPHSIRSAFLELGLAQVNKMQLESGDNEGLRKFRDRLTNVAARSDLTSYQDPVTISEILECWDLIQEGNSGEALQCADTNAHPSNVVLATAHTGNLNASAVQGDDGTKGVLFEVDLQVWATMMSCLIQELLVTETPETYQIRHPSDGNAFVGKETILDRMFETFAGTVINGTANSTLKNYTAPKSMEEKKIRELINKGFITFVAGHELAHLTREHHNMEAKGGYWVPKNVGETIAKYEAIYASKYPGMTMEVAAAKIMRQGLELQADYYGYLYTSNTYRLHPSMQILIQNADGIVAGSPTLNVLFIEIGARAFFWSIEFLERTVRTLLTGHDGSGLGIYSTDFDVQDLIGRDSHPCPLSRIAMANQFFRIAPPVNEILGTMFQKAWKTAYPRIQALHASGVRPHEKWINPATEFGAQLKLCDT